MASDGPKDRITRVNSADIAAIEAVFGRDMLDDDTPPPPAALAPWRTIKHDRFGKDAGFGDRLRICCISSPFKIDDWGDANQATPDFRLAENGDHCVTAFAGDHTRWRNDRLAELRAALESNPDIVAFSEFAYTPIADAAQRDADSLFIQEALRALKDKDSRAFVFCGSHHSNAKENVGIIFPFGANEFKEGAERRDYLTYIKRNSTPSIGELIETARAESLPAPAVVRPEGYVTVLMSAEVVDVAQIHKIAYRNQNTSGSHTAMDVVVVPSFATDRNEPVDAMCQYLSRWTATTVIHVNANTVAEGFPQAAIFVCGKRLDQAHQSDLLIGHTPELLALPSGATSTLHTFVLNRELITVERREWMEDPAMKRFMVPVSRRGAKFTRNGP